MNLPGALVLIAMVLAPVAILAILKWGDKK